MDGVYKLQTWRGINEKSGGANHIFAEQHMINMKIIKNTIR
jgi:hypothetical protein